MFCWLRRGVGSFVLLVGEGSREPSQAERERERESGASVESAGKWRSRGRLATAPLSAALLCAADAIRLTGVEVGGRRFTPLLDTASALTWLPVAADGLSLTHGQPGSCEPTGDNFSLSYADGTRVAGVKCIASLSLTARRPDQIRTRIRWTQLVGAASVINEPSALRRSRTLGAHMGILAFSPASSSSLWPLLCAVPNRPSVTISAGSAKLIVGASHGGSDPLRLCSTLPHESPRSHDPSRGTCPASFNFPDHWNFGVSSAVVARGAIPPLPDNGTTWMRALPTPAVAQLDSGASHIVAPRTSRLALLDAAYAPASLAFSLTSAATPSRCKRVLSPLSHGCSSPNHVSLTACLRSTAVPMLAPRQDMDQWILGVPFFNVHEITMRISSPGLADSTQGGGGVCNRDTGHRWRSQGPATISRGSVWGQSRAMGVHRSIALEVLVRPQSAGGVSFLVDD